jgi:phytoene dehydrogenase-like protein
VWRHLRPAPSALVAAFATKGPLPALAHHNLFFPVDWQASLVGLSAEHAGRLSAPAFLHVARPSASDAGSVPKGRDALVITAPLPADPLLGATEASQTGMRELARDFLRQVAHWVGTPRLADHAELLAIVTPSDFNTRYGSWRGSAMGLEHTRAQTTLRRPRNASSRVRNLYYAGGSTLPGVGIASALVSAELVAKRLLGDRSPRPLTVPVVPGFLLPSEPAVPEDSDPIGTPRVADESKG